MNDLHIKHWAALSGYTHRRSGTWRRSEQEKAHEQGGGGGGGGGGTCPSAQQGDVQQAKKKKEGADVRLTSVEDQWG